MKRRLTIPVVLFALSLAAIHAHANTIAWKNASSGNWSDTANWNPKHVPGPNDTADITKSGNYTVTLDVAASVSGLILGAGNGTTQTFLLNGQTFTLAGQATINPDGLIDLSSGTFSGDTNSTGGIVNGTLTCSGGVLSGKLTLASNSVINLSSASTPFGSLTAFTNNGTVNWSNADLSSTANLQVYNYGLWDAKSNKVFYGPASFYNYGTFRKSSGSSFPTVLNTNLTFINFGVVDVQSGGLLIESGYGTSSGVFNTATNTYINFYRNIFYSYGASFAGSGVIIGPYGGLSGTNIVSGGYLAFSNMTTLSGTLTVASNAIMNLGEGIGLSNIVLNNYGTVTRNSTNSLEGSSGLKINNYGLWDAQANGTMSGFIFNNYGTFRKSGGTIANAPYTSTMDATTTFNNYGTVDIESGQMNFLGSCVCSGGLFNTVSNTYFGFVTCILNGTSTFTGPGTFIGTLSGNNAVIQGTENFKWGTLSGTITLASNNVLNLMTYFTTSLNNLRLTNYGTVEWSSGGYDLSGNGSSVVFVNNYGLWDAQANATMSGVTFNNYGTFRKSGGAFPGGFTSLDNNTTFSNYGLVDTQVGGLLINGGGTSASGSVFNTASNAFMGPAYLALTGDVTFTGDGRIVGGLTGSNAVIHGLVAFNYANLTGTLTLASNAVMYLSPYPDQPLGFNGTVFTNYGTVVWTNNDLNGTGSPQIYNYGLWNATGNNTFYGSRNLFGGSSSGTTTFNNYGTFRKSGGVYGDSPSFTYLDNSTSFNNAGTIDVLSGVLLFGQSSGGGTFNTTNIGNGLYGDGIWFNNHLLNGTAVFTGNGAVNGNVTGSNAVITGAWTFVNGTLSGTLTVASNATLNLDAAAGRPELSGTLLTNYGTVNWLSGPLFGESAMIFNFGLWNAQTDDSFYGYLGGGVTTFNNYGTFRKSGGSSPYGSTFESNTDFNNSGVVDVQIGLLAIDHGTGSGTFNTVGNGSFESDGQFYFGSYILTGNPVFTGTGKIAGHLTGNNAVLHGSLNLDSGTVFGTLTAASNCVFTLVGDVGSLNFSGIVFTNYGTVVWSNANLYCSSSPQIYNYGLWDARGNNTFYGGYGGGTTTFNNYGTFRKSGGISADYPYETVLDNNTVFNNPGTVDVQVGLLSLGGSYSLAGGTMNFGINNSNDFGSINLNGNAALAGALSVNFNNGYSPAVSNSFPVVYYNSETGTFTSLNLPTLPPTLSWQTNYGATTFTLNIVTTPPPQLSAVKFNVSSNSISFSWNALSGQTYQVQCTTNLTPANWVNLGNPISGTNGTMTVPDILTSPQKFYRLQLQ